MSTNRAAVPDELATVLVIERLAAAAGITESRDVDEPQ